MGKGVAPGRSEKLEKVSFGHRYKASAAMEMVGEFGRVSTGKWLEYHHI